MTRRTAGRANPAQLSLFGALPAAATTRFSAAPLVEVSAAAPAATGLSDEALLEGLRAAAGERLDECLQEIAQRRLEAAIPAVMAVARIYAPEPQIAALQTLAAIGGVEAARAVTALMRTRAMTGTALLSGIVIAAALGCRLPAAVLQPFVRASDPAVRLALCQCLQGGAESVGVLQALVQDADHEVACTAARALALRGLPDGVAALVGALRRAPTQADIEAVAVIADETLMVELGKSARAHPTLAPQIIDALDSLEAPRASLIATGLRRDLA